MSDDYQVVITRDLVPVATGDAHSQFSARVEWVGPGEWRAAWPLEHRGARLMLEAVAGDGEDPYQWGVAVRPRGSASTSVAGFATAVGVVEGAPSGHSPDSIIAHGLTDMAILSHRVGFPDPTVDVPTSGTHTWSVAVDGPWDNAEDAIVDLINANAGPGAVTRREHPDLVVPASQGRGGPISFARRFPTLLETVRAICLVSGLTVRVDRVGAELHVVIGEQVRNQVVRWSRAAGTATGVALLWRGASATSVVVGGAGEGTARVFARVDASSAGGFGWLRESFVDATSAATAAELHAQGEEALAERAAGVSAQVDIFPAIPWRLGDDFQVGDLTPVDVGLGSLSSVQAVLARIEATSLAHEGGSWVTTPEVGEPMGDPLHVQRRLFTELRRRGRI